MADDADTTGLAIGKFFDSLSDDYTQVIEECFPRYREMLWALLDYLPADRPFRNLLELGCGTGNLSVLLSQHFPDATLRVVDVSEESLQVCRQRLQGNHRLSFVQQDFRSLECAAAEFDLVISSIAIHHLTGEQKRRLFGNVAGWLKPGGIFAYADQFRGATTAVYQKHIENWRSISMAAGSTEQQWQMWMQHQHEHDHHDSLGDQIDWLEQAGFPVVDCVWRYLLWSVLIAER